MPQFAYASVGVNLQEFMAGKNPTTQPGVEVSYYNSMSAAMENAEFEFDGKNSASCIMMFDVDAVKTKLTPSPNPNILGRGTITPQHIVDAMLQIKGPGKAEPLYVDAGKCDWNQARATVQLTQEKQQNEQALAAYHAFMKGSLQWTEHAGVTELATTMFEQYAQQQFEHAPFGNNEAFRLHTYDDMQTAFFEAYRAAADLPEAQQIIAGLEAVNKVMEQHLPPQMESDMGLPSVFADEKGVVDPHIFYRDAAHQRPDPSDIFSQQQANYYAALQFSFLPDNLRDITTNAFNEKLCAISVENEHGKVFEAKDVMTAIAYTWHKEIDRVQQEAPANITAQALRFGRHALEYAMYLGATADEITKEPAIVLQREVPADTVPGVESSQPVEHLEPLEPEADEPEEPEEP